MERYIAFDVETPNSLNHRMSAIGIAVVENGKIAEQFFSLVNPETRFDHFNIELTGITPRMVLGAPTFPVLWREIEPMMSGGILLAHNASFDLSVLGKCLQDYGISWKPQARYACTCRMSRAYFPQLPNHKLNTVSAYLGVDLEHHQADSDTKACAEIFCACVNRGMPEGEFVKTFDFRTLKTLP